MQFDILTIFPDIVHVYASESILGRGQKKGLISIKAHNFRAFSPDKHQHVDDRPYGGGPGMILEVEPIYKCLEAMGLVKDGKKMKLEIRNLKFETNSKSKILNLKSKIIIMDPAGKKFDQRMAERFAKLDRLVFISGRYEGFDERIYKFVDEKVSVGDYVLAGGELPALTIIEAVSRLIPGVLGNAESLEVETHGKSEIRNSKSETNSKLEIRNSKLEILAEYPQYTRPEEFMGMKVPKVLLSGDHRKIEEWRKKHSR